MALCPPQAAFPVSSNAGVVIAARASEGTTPTDADFVEVLNPQASVAWPRMITIISREGYAFDAKIKYSVGRGVGGTFVVTSQGGIVRVQVLATSLVISVANWTAAANTIDTSVECQEVVSRLLQHRIVRGAIAVGSNVTFTVPAYASTVRCSCDDNDRLGSLILGFFDQAGTGINKTSGDDGDVAVGTARTIRIDNYSGVAIGSVILDFTLSV